MILAGAKTQRILRGIAGCVVVSLALANVVVLAYVLARRITYPMDLEWLEGQQVYEAYRFIHGLSVYGPPTQGFVPSPYPPVHFMSVGLVGLVTGLDYWTGRFVSDAAVVSVIVVQTLAFLRTTRNRWLAWALSAAAAGGVNVANHALSGCMDLARADSLAFGLVVVAAALVIRMRRTWPRAVALSAVVALAVYTKQNNVFYAAWLVGWLAWRDRVQALRVVGVSSVLGLAILGALQLWTHGWFWTWLTEMGHHPFVLAKWRYAESLSLAAAPLLLTAPVLLGVLVWRGWLQDETKLWVGMLVMAVPACVVPTLADGGWVNNIIALGVLGWFVPILLAADLLRGLSARPALSSWAAVALAAGVAFCLRAGLHDPGELVPGAEPTSDAEALHTLVRGLDGDVLVPMYPFVAPRDGKTTPQPALIPYLDAVNRGGVKVDIGATMRDVHAKWVILCGHDIEDLVTTWLGAAYVVNRRLPLHVQAFVEQTGSTMVVMRRVDAP